MFGSEKKKQEVGALADKFKEKISELHLLIQSGTLTPADLSRAEAALKVLRRKLGERMKSETEKMGGGRAALA